MLTMTERPNSTFSVQSAICPADHLDLRPEMTLPSGWIRARGKDITFARRIEGKLLPGSGLLDCFELSKQLAEPSITSDETHDRGGTGSIHKTHNLLDPGVNLLVQQRLAAEG